MVQVKKTFFLKSKKLFGFDYTNQKNIFISIVSIAVILGMTFVLLSIMKDSYPFNAICSNSIGNELNSNSAQTKITANEKSIIAGVFLLMALISVKVRKTINQI